LYFTSNVGASLDQAIDEKPSKRIVPVEVDLDESGIWAFESQHGDTFHMDPTRHRFLKLLLITAGAGVIEGDWGVPVCKKGDLVVVPAGMWHRIIDHHRQPISLYGLGIANKWFRPVDRVASVIPTGILKSEQLGPLKLENRMRRLLYAHRCDGPLNRLASLAAALDLVAQVSLAVTSQGFATSQLSTTNDFNQASFHDTAPSIDDTDERVADEVATQSDPLIDSYLTWLQHNFFEPQTLADAARTCGMSRRGFTTAFRKHTGLTWLDHINRLRTQHAITLLETTNRKMASIAFQCGFEDLSTFYRVMHRVTGRRPGDYRRK
jgi:AraC-like DNA-binding protein/mannose-6-phosphate isomerase-like protein (cupin superfamily)